AGSYLESAGSQPVAFGRCPNAFSFATHRSPITSEFRGKLSRTLGQTVPLPDCGTLRLTGRMEHSSGEVLLMRRVSSRRKPKSTAVHKRAGRRAHKSAVVASIPRRRPVGGFYVVGLGASAGGLEALRSFFAAVPAKSGVAFVVIQHLAPSYLCRMFELLVIHTTLPISLIDEVLTIMPILVMAIWS